MPLLVASDLTKTYTGGTATVSALAGVSFALERGRLRGADGPVGLRQVHAAAPVRRHGPALVGHASSSRAARWRRCRTTRSRVLRRDRIGFVFQFFNLLPTLTLGDNIALPCLLGGMAVAEAEGRAARLAARVGIGHRLKHYPQEVSGGEMQRAALARALVHEPALLVADEPTGNLDSENGAKVLALLAELNREMGITILLATHAAEVASAAAASCGCATAGSSRPTCPCPTMFLRLFRQFILRRMAQERARTATTVVGIALGIAVVIAIQLTNGSSVRGFETALEHRRRPRVAGDPGHRAASTRRLLRDLGWLREFGAMSPGDRGRDGHRSGTGRRHGRARARRGPASPGAAQRGGEGAGRGHPPRPDRSATTRWASATRLAQSASATDAMTSQQFLELLTSPRSVVITEKMARRRGYALGGEIRLMAGDRVEHLRHPRAAEGRGAGARDGRQLRADGHRRGAAGVRSAGPRRPRRRAADRRRRHGADHRRDRRVAQRHCVAAAGRAHRAAAGRGAASRWSACWRRFT